MSKDEEIGVSSPFDLQAFISYLEGRADLATSSRSKYAGLVKAYFKRSRPFNIDSIRDYLAKKRSKLIRSALILYAESKGMEDFAIRVRLIKVKPKKRKPHEVENYETMNAIIDKLGDEEKYIALFLLNTGVRIQEAIRIVREDIKPDGKVVITKKGGNYREIYVPSAFFAQLINYTDEIKGILPLQKIFYTHDTGTPETMVKKFHERFNKVAKKMTGHTIGTHDFRRLCATYLYNKTRDIQLVQRHLGHTSIATTSIYTSYVDTEKDLRKASRLLNLLEEQKERSKTESA